MKVERTESKFEPVVIVLESQFEVDVLRELIASVEITTINETSNLIENLSYELAKYTNQDLFEDRYLAGIIEINEDAANE